MLLEKINWIDVTIYLVLAVFICLAVRELMTWYWKINHIVSKLDNIDKNLHVIVTKIDPEFHSDPINIDTKDHFTKEMILGNEKYKVK